MVPSPEVTWNKILTRISRIHGVSLEELRSQDQEDVVAHYWRYISQQNLERLSLGADIAAKVAERDKRNRRYIKMKELEQCGYFELVKVHARSQISIFILFISLCLFPKGPSKGGDILIQAKDRDPGLYETLVGRDRVGRPEGQMKFSDVLMRCWMQERDPDTNKRKIDQPLESRNGTFSN